MTWPAFLSASAAILVAGVLGLLIYETRALLIRRGVLSPPAITDIIKGAEAAHHRWTVTLYFIAGALVGWLVGHLGAY